MASRNACDFVQWHCPIGVEGNERMPTLGSQINVRGERENTFTDLVVSGCKF